MTRRLLEAHLGGAEHNVREDLVFAVEFLWKLYLQTRSQSRIRVMLPQKRTCVSEQNRGTLSATATRAVKYEHIVIKWSQWDDAQKRTPSEQNRSATATCAVNDEHID